MRDEKIRKYFREYARLRRFLYRLKHPKKQAGRKLGTKDKVPRRKYIRKPATAAAEKLMKSTHKLGKFDWDRT